MDLFWLLAFVLLNLFGCTPYFYGFALLFVIIYMYMDLFRCRLYLHGHVSVLAFIFMDVFGCSSSSTWTQFGA